MSTVPTCVFRCIENRIDVCVEEYLESRGWKNHASHRIPGGVIDLAFPEGPAHREVYLDHIAKILSIKRPERIVLVAHAECGGYQGRVCFNSHTEEEAMLIAHLNLGKKIIAHRYPHVQVLKVLIHRHEEGGWSAKEIIFSAASKSQSALSQAQA